MKKLLLFIALFIFLSKFCEKQTDSFQIFKLSTCLLEGEAKPLESPLLNQKYAYLCKGGQSFVFLSEDGRYVLKLFRSPRLNTLETFFPFFKEKIQKQRDLLKEALLSCQIAERDLKKECALVVTHLTHTPVKGSLTLIDKLGIEHKIDPNLYPFFIQERAITVKERVSQLMEKKDIQGVKLALGQLLSLIQLRENKGVQDRDPNLSKNFGFVNDRPVQIDIGRFSLEGGCEEKQHSSWTELQNWMHKNYPELIHETF